jgi:nitrogen-specific signal transduction histidine kinase/ligand-binding sensor protein
MGEDKTFIENAHGTFIENTQPKNILEIMSKDLLKMLLDSYRFPVQTSLTVYYSESTSIDMKTIAWFEMPDQKEEMRFNSPFCYTYRHTPPECEEYCKLCDRRITLKYYNGEWREPKLFRCHLRLWEMTYPLFAWGRLVAVLYGGQVIVTEPVEDWGKALEEVKDEVVWDPFVGNQGGDIPQKNNQTDDILIAIEKAEELKDVDNKKKELIEILEKEKGKKVDLNQLLKRYDRFKKFGETLERVIDDLFSAKAEAARRKHIHSSSRDIAAGGDQWSEDPHKFWNALDAAVKDTLPGVRGYVLYELDEYEERFKSERTCVYNKQLLPEKSEADFRHFCKQVFEESRENAREKGFVLYDLTTEATAIKYRDLLTLAITDWEQILGRANVIIVPSVEGREKITGGLVCLCAGDEKKTPDTERLSFYAEALTDIAATLSMVMTRHAVKERREKQLGRLTHELKVPLVAIRGATEFIMRTPSVKKFFDYDYPGDIWSWTELMGRLIDKADALRYSGEKLNIVPVQTFILRDVIASAIRQTSLLLEERGFSTMNINYNKENLHRFPPLWIDRNMFQQVVFNLLVNSVKYAYKDPRAFRVEIEGNEIDLTMIFRDWGPGINQGLEELIFDEGFRGPNAVESDVTGQGLGLWLVRQIIEAHGGEVKVTKLRWPTEFTIWLPYSITSPPPVSSKGD